MVAQEIVKHYISDGLRNLLCRTLNLTASELEAHVGYIVSLHDTGKIEHNFQAKDAAMADLLRDKLKQSLTFPIERIRHEKTSQIVLGDIWNQYGVPRRTTDVLSKVIGAHHQGKTGSGQPNNEPFWKDLQTKYEQNMRDAFLRNNALGQPVVEKEYKGVVGAIMLAILIMSDWISSGPAFEDAETWIHGADAEQKIHSEIDTFFARSRLIPSEFDWPNTFCGMWMNIPESGKRSLQAETERVFENRDVKYSLVLLEAPMGEGKTEAGLYAAMQMMKQWKKNGLYVALPTAATANQMVGRVQDLLKMHNIDDKVRLLHNMAWLEDQNATKYRGSEEADGIANWLVPTRRGLLGQYAVGTVDQAMLAAMNVKYGALRLLGLANKVLVIDEIHSYDAYMSESLHRLLEWCHAMQVPVVMLSATLPPKKKRELFQSYTTQPLSSSYPLITAISDDGTVHETVIPFTTHKMTANVRTSPILNDPEKIAEAAIAEVADGGCLCVYMNTVKEAQAVYSAIKSKYTGDLILYHAQFPIRRRVELEKACIKRYGKDTSNRPARSILVATQVAEQSLDVDFDVVYTAIAPIDFILQRLGREHRHESTKRPARHRTPNLVVLCPDKDEGFGSSRFIYPECLLKSSSRLLHSATQIRTPDDVADLVSKGYDSENVPPEDIEQWKENLVKEQVEAGASLQFLINSPNKQYNALIDSLSYDDENGVLQAATRLGEPSTRVALLDAPLFDSLKPYIEEQDGEFKAVVWRKDVAMEVMLNSVSIRTRRLGIKVNTPDDVYGDKLLSGTRIIRMTDGSAVLGNGKVIINDPEMGVQIKDGGHDSKI